MSVEDNLATFILELNNSKGDVDKRLSKAIKWATFDIYRTLTRDPRAGGGQYGTPRLESRAVSGWFAEAGKSSTDAPSEQEKPNLTRAKSSLNTICFENPYQPFYLTNNVPYIINLNFGSSTQAPRDFIRLAIEQTKEKFNSKKW